MKNREIILPFTAAEREVLRDLASLNPGVTEDLLMSCYRKIPRTPDYIEYRFAYNAYSRPPLVDISPLSRLERLGWIELVRCAVSDLTPVAALPNLAALRVSQNMVPIPNCDLTGLYQLKRISLSDFPVHSLKITGLSNLESIYLSQSSLTSLPAMDGLRSLKDLTISDNPELVDLTPLTACTGLETLTAHHTGVSVLTPLSSLTNLRELTLSFTPVTDVTPLKYCTNLERLWLYGTPVDDVSSLAALPSLKDLDLHKTKVTDLSAFDGRKEIIGIERKKLGPVKAKKSAAEMKEQTGQLRMKLEAMGIEPGPRLNADDIKGFEAEYGISLPKEYAAFLKQVGDGFEITTGPDRFLYRLLPLTKTVIDSERVGKRFQLKDAWIWEDEANPSEERLTAAAANGQLELMDCGCGRSYRLIICGPAKGEVWELADVGISPYKNGEDFLKWLLDFLEEIAQ